MQRLHVFVDIAEVIAEQLPGQNDFGRVHAT